MDGVVGPAGIANQLQGLDGVYGTTNGGGNDGQRDAIVVFAGLVLKGVVSQWSRCSRLAPSVGCSMRCREDTKHNKC